MGKQFKMDASTLLIAFSVIFSFCDAQITVGDNDRPNAPSEGDVDSRFFNIDFGNISLGGVAETALGTTLGNLTPGIPMDMLATPTLTEPTEAITATLTPTTERGLLMLSPRPRPRLTPGILMVPMLATPTPTLASTTVTLDTTLDTPMLTTERGLLMPSPRPRLIPG